MLEKSNTFLCTLTPVEGSHAVDIDEGNQPRQDEAENRLHPRAHLQTLTAICFCKEVIPAPAELITAEESKHQRAKRQNIIGNKEVPEIQPCCTFCEGLKMNDAEAQRRCQREQEDADAADDAALRTRPACQLTNHGEDIFAYAEYRGQCREYHEQEEQGAPDTTAGHVIENSRHGIKQQTGSCGYFEVIGEAGREDDYACEEGNQRIQKNDMDCFAHQGAFLADIAAENCHAAHTCGQGEECLIHCTNHNGAFDFGEIGLEVEAHPFAGTAQKQAMDCQREHQHQKGRHHIFCDTFQTALQVEGENKERNNQCNQQEQHIDRWRGYHGTKAEARMVPDEESEEIIDNPTADNGVKCHQRDIPCQTAPAEDAPFLSGLFQLFIHEKRACLRCSPDGKFQNKRGNPQKNQTENIDQHEAAAAILSTHPWKFPDIPAANGTACGKHDEAQTASELFTFHERIPLSFTLSCLLCEEQDIFCSCFYEKLIIHPYGILYKKT